VTLRLRLVLGLAGLALVGLAVFGVTTYSLYARSQFQRLDDQMRSAVGFVSGQARSGGEAHGGDGDGGRGGPGGSPSLVPLAAYWEVRDSTGALERARTDATATPALPAVLTASGGQTRFLTAGDWRVYVTPFEGGRETLVVAVPLTEVRTALNRLVLIEAGGGAALLAILCAGAWLVLRRGLKPLEEMAETAGDIAAGDLAQRVVEGPDEVGQLGRALNTMLSEIESAFAERDATEHRLRQFLADASHELRTPLTSIQGFAELFRLGGDKEHADTATMLRRIEEESARMRVLVEDLLLLARLDETRPIERAPVDLAVLAADACSDAVAIAPDRPVTLDAPEPVVVQGDQPLLRQAVANLVANAVRHTPEGTAIDVRARREDGAAVLIVRDHGRGLDDEALAHVFDRFWQADRARAGTSTGLGLSIVAGIAAEHGGAATAENGPDGGALFTLRLPLNGT
jgi:two-component system OmpR family sensor kinase